MEMDFFRKIRFNSLLLLLICQSVTSSGAKGDIDFISKSLSWNRVNTTFVMEDQTKYGMEGRVFYSLCDKITVDSSMAHCVLRSFSYSEAQHREECNLTKPSHYSHILGYVAYDNGTFKSLVYDYEDAYSHLLEVRKMWRTSENKIAFAYKRMSEYDPRNRVLREIDIRDCRILRDDNFWLRDDATHPKNYSDGQSEHVIVYDDSHFDLLVGNTWNTYRDRHKAYASRDSFLPIQLQGMQVDTVQETVFASGYEPLSNRYKVFRRYRASSKRHAELSSFDPPLESVSTSGKRSYVLCRMISRTLFSTTVLCLRYDESSDGPTSSPVTIEFAEQVRLLKVLLSEDERIILLAENSTCTGSECWNLILARHFNDEVRIARRPFHCSGRRDKVIVNFNGDCLTYACEDVDADDETKAFLRVQRFFLSEDT